MGFKIGDEVVTKKTGLPGVARIVGLVLPEVLNGGALSKWDELFPEWRNHEVAYIKYKKPQKPCSYEEFLESIPPELEYLSEEDKELQYLNGVPYQKHSMVPVCDLEKFA